MMTQPLALTFICLCPVFVHSECDFKKTNKKIPWTKASCSWSQPKIEIFEKFVRSWLDDFFHVRFKSNLYFYILYFKEVSNNPQNVLSQNIFSDCPHSFLICSFLVVEIRLIFNWCHFQSKATLMGIFGRPPHILFSLCKIFFNCNLLGKEVKTNHCRDSINSFSREKNISESQFLMLSFY